MRERREGRELVSVGILMPIMLWMSGAQQVVFWLDKGDGHDKGIYLMVLPSRLGTKQSDKRELVSDTPSFGGRREVKQAITLHLVQEPPGENKKALRERLSHVNTPTM
jgi:uncharacterized protein YlaN (UPF0358 family)